MRGIAQKTKDLIECARRVLTRENPMGLRQLHYRIFSLAELEYANDESSYDRLGNAMTYARRLYREWELLVKKADSPKTRETWATPGTNKNSWLVVEWLRAHHPKILGKLIDGLIGEELWQKIVDGLPLIDRPPAFSIPPTWMSDETRELERVGVFDDASAYAEAVKGSYRRDYWKTQPYHVEVWAEKGTVLASLRPVTEELGVGLRVTHGYSSTGMEQEVGRLFEGIDKPIVVLYVGDCDASGEHMQGDIHSRAMVASGRRFEMRRLAIFLEDIERFNLPPQTIKLKDSGAAIYQREHGKNAPTIELDALPPEELRRRVDEAIRELIDWEDWDRQVNVEEAELARIVDFADCLKHLPPPPPPPQAA
jgi:hypothetical protein